MQIAIAIFKITTCSQHDHGKILMKVVEKHITH